MNYPIRAKRTRNLGPRDRLISMVAGAGLLAVAARISKGLRIPLMLGSGFLFFRSVSGRDPISQSIAQTLGVYQEEGETVVRVQRSITIDQPRNEVFAFWRDFRNLPRFMHHLESVNQSGSEGDIYHWVAKAPFGQTVEWDSQVTEEKENELLAWSSIPGSEVSNSGKVTFHDATNGSGTEIKVDFRYEPPMGGTAGVLISRLAGEEPDIQVREDLRRLKRILETGEVISTKGQSSGRIGEVEEQRGEAVKYAEEFYRRENLDEGGNV